MRDQVMKSKNGVQRFFWLSFIFSVFLLVAPTLAQSDVPVLEAKELGRETGLPIPRYVSLKSNKINLRTGPGFRYPVEWVFQRKYLPLVVVEEFENWRQVRTHDGVLGWLHKNMITGVRTFRVQSARALLFVEPNVGSLSKAELSEGVVGTLELCQARWCYVEVRSSQVSNLDGWMKAQDLFGVDEGELFQR